MSAAAWLNGLAEDWNERLVGLGRVRTPAYVYSQDCLLDRLTALQNAFAKHRMRVLVSVKANPNPMLIKAMLGEKAGMDVASSKELKLVGDAEGSFISLVGPGKSVGLIRAAARMRIDQVVVESMRDLTILARSLGRGFERPAILLRVNPAGQATDANEVMGGRASQFGTDEEDIGQLVKAARDFGAPVAGLHYHLGSQIREIVGIRNNADLAVDSAIRIRERTGVSLRTVNLGGGSGLPHQPGHPPELRPEALADISGEAISRLSSAVGESVDGQIEVGRYLYAPAGVFLCRVVDVKQSRGQRFVITNCGITGFARPAVRWGEWHPVWKLGEAPKYDAGDTFTIVGPTCMPGDLIANQVRLNAPREGDVLVVGLTGAYGYTMSLLDWGSPGRKVAEIVV
jgi:diaminopimelate decarboxylase